MDRTAIALTLALLLAGCATTTVIRDGKPETVLCERDLLRPGDGWGPFSMPPFTASCATAH